MTVFKDPNQEACMTGPWYERLEKGYDQHQAEVYDHADGSCTIQIMDMRYTTRDHHPKIVAAKWYPDAESIDIDAEVRAMGYEPDPFSEQWGYMGDACWFDPEGFTGDSTERYGIRVYPLGCVPTEKPEPISLPGLREQVENISKDPDAVRWMLTGEPPEGREAP
ncbi:hypothetical protein [Streptomyces chrestomyceticus]|uniref:hypothetical protein n=1 Tax=Streptomyces chrestomyceticus TaxID=68185 RepID=UPI0037A57B09